MTKSKQDDLRAAGAAKRDRNGIVKTEANSEEQQQDKKGSKAATATTLTRQERLDRIKRDADNRKTFKEGQLVHRTEPDIKTHTSYLVFAVLPEEWSPEDEEKCLAKWGTGPLIKDSDKKSKKAQKVLVNHGQGESKKAKKRKAREEAASRAQGGDKVREEVDKAEDSVEGKEAE